VILIEGETGLGKTLLLEELAGWAFARGLHVIRGGTTVEHTRNLLATAAKQAPVVILIDEAQDLDPSFWELALSLARQAIPACLVIATRPLPMPLPESYLELFMLPSTRRISLAPLSQDEMTAMACQYLSVDNISRPLHSLFAGLSGNPYFLLETVNLLRETGALLVHGRQASLAPGVDLEAMRLPSSVQGVVASRLDRLTLEEHLVLKVASVIGQLFPLPLLQAIYPVEEHKGHLGELLQSLEWQDLVTGTEEGRLYRFNQPVTWELAYNSMLFSQRRQLHRQAAEWYEGQADKEYCSFEVLSDHWLKAGEPMKALHYLEKAGQEAYQRGEFTEAERLFQACLELESKAAVLADGDVEPTGL
jgi:predicted ATPase